MSTLEKELVLVEVTFLPADANRFCLKLNKENTVTSMVKKKTWRKQVKSNRSVSNINTTEEYLEQDVYELSK